MVEDAFEGADQVIATVEEIENVTSPSSSSSSSDNKFFITGGEEHYILDTVASFKLLQSARKTAFTRPRCDVRAEFGHLKHNVASIRERHQYLRLERQLRMALGEKIRMVLLAMQEKSKRLEGPPPNPWSWYLAFGVPQPGEDIEPYGRGPVLTPEDFNHTRRHLSERQYSRRRELLQRQGNYTALYRLAKRQGDQDSKALLKSACANYWRMCFIESPNPLRSDMFAVAQKMIDMTSLTTDLCKKRVIDVLHFARQPMLNPRGTPRLLPRLSFSGSAAVMPMTQLGPTWAPPYSNAQAPRWARLDALLWRRKMKDKSEKQLRGSKNKKVVGRSVSVSPPIVSPSPSPSPSSASSPSSPDTPPDMQSMLHTATTTTNRGKRKRGASMAEATPRYSETGAGPAHGCGMACEEEEGGGDDDDDDDFGYTHMVAAADRTP